MAHRSDLWPGIVTTCVSIRLIDVMTTNCVSCCQMYEDPAVQVLWDLVAAHMRADKNATMVKLAQKLKHMRLVDWFNDEAVRDQEVSARHF